MKKIINTVNAPAAIGPYEQAIMVGDALYTSGQIPLDLNGNVVPGGVKEQAHQLFKNLDAVLQCAGISNQDVVKTMCFLQDLNDFEEFNKIYADYFGANMPARSCVEVSKLPKGVLVEVEAIAIRAR